MVGTLRFAHHSILCASVKAAAYGFLRSQERPRNSLHLFVRVDAPQPLLLDPAVKTVADHAAPAIGAFLDLGDDAGLQAGRNRAGAVGAIVERGKLVPALHGDDRGAA